MPYMIPNAPQLPQENEKADLLNIMALLTQGIGGYRQYKEGQRTIGDIIPRPTPVTEPQFNQNYSMPQQQPQSMRMNMSNALRSLSGQPSAPMFKNLMSTGMRETAPGPLSTPRTSMPEMTPLQNLAWGPGGLSKTRISDVPNMVKLKYLLPNPYDADKLALRKGDQDLRAAALSQKRESMNRYYSNKGTDYLKIALQDNRERLRSKLMYSIDPEDPELADLQDEGEYLQEQLYGKLGGKPPAQGGGPGKSSYVIVSDKDGKQFKLPKTQLKQAKGEGYSYVKDFTE